MHPIWLHKHVPRGIAPGSSTGHGAATQRALGLQLTESATQRHDLQVTAVIQHRSLRGTCWCAMTVASAWKALRNSHCFAFFFFKQHEILNASP